MSDPCPPDCVCAGCEAAVGAAFEAELDRQDGIATLRAQLAEARAEVERVTRERDEARATALENFRDAMRLQGEVWQMQDRAEDAERERDEARAQAGREREAREYLAKALDEIAHRADIAERERDEARAELAAERARREADASPYAVIAGAAGALHGKGIDGCPHPKGSHPEALWGLGWWEVTARRHEKRVAIVAAEAARWKTWARLAVAAYVEAEGERDGARVFEADWDHWFEECLAAQSALCDERARADAAEARARGLVEALAFIAHHQPDLCSAVQAGGDHFDEMRKLAQAALAAAEGGETR
jgi:hypothetical protein